MKKLLVLSAIVATGFMTGCSTKPSGNDAGPQDAGPQDAGPQDAGPQDAGPPDAGPPVNPFECTVPGTPPSAGSCVTLGSPNDAGTGFQCNPVTNGGCQTGEECDTNVDQNSGDVIGFVCYPPPNDAALCGTCNDSSANGPFCQGGTTCFPIDNAGDSVCAQYCCTDADCGAGTCVMTDQNSDPLFGSLGMAVGVCAN